MLFSDDARALSLSIPYSLDLADAPACRGHLRRMGWAVDRMHDIDLTLIRLRAMVYRAADRDRAERMRQTRAKLSIVGAA